MKDWTAGYVADIDYTFGYYTELNPLRIKLAFISKGLEFPEIKNACELGFGQGISVNIHAAASTVSWYGTDFNPAQAACAQKLTSVSDSGAELYDESFEDFIKRDSLPEFDFIALHGIWSWISDDNRNLIVEFVKRKLRVGGVLYVSYNTYPGWSNFAPMRHLMAKHSETFGMQGAGTVSRVNHALEFAKQLVELTPSYVIANPAVTARLQKVSEQNRHYLAHEYFNRDWNPMYFSEMADWLQSSKVSFAASAHYLDHVDVLNLTSDQQAFVQKVNDPHFRENVKDFMVNQQFRRDYWVKGLRTMPQLERIQILREQRIILTVYRKEVVLKVSGALGEASMTEAVYNPILDYLADYEIRSISDIESAVNSRGINLNQIIQAVLVLISQGVLHPAQDDGCIKKAKKHSSMLNAHLLNKARSNNDIPYLSSPVTGGGIHVGRFNQLFLMFNNQGKKTVDELATSVAEVLDEQDQKILKDGKTITDPKEALSELKEQAKNFTTRLLPIYRALQIL